MAKRKTSESKPRRKRQSRIEVLKTINPNIWSSKDKSQFRKTPEWKNFCIQLKEERGNKCELCGIDTGRCLVVHHKYLSDDKRNYTKLEPDRFFVLCPLCHNTIHRWHTTWNRKKNPVKPSHMELYEIVSKMVINGDGLDQ